MGIYLLSVPSSSSTTNGESHAYQQEPPWRGGHILMRHCKTLNPVWRGHLAFVTVGRQGRGNRSLEDGRGGYILRA